MPQHIPERDWRLFSKLRKLALERFCERTLDEVKNVLAGAAASHHERYVAIYKIVDSREAELARLFDDFRRSTAVVQLAALCARNLITEEERADFTAETQKVVKLLARPSRR